MTYREFFRVLCNCLERVFGSNVQMYRQISDKQNASVYIRFNGRRLGVFQEALLDWEVGHDHRVAILNEFRMGLAEDKFKEVFSCAGGAA